MKRHFLILAVLLFGALLLNGCPAANSPSSPSGPTATATGTLPTATFTFTHTETQLCVSPLSFGKNTIGASNSVFSSPNVFAVKYSLPVDGKVIRLYAHVSSSPTPGTSLRMGLYSDNGGNPDALLSESTPKTAVTGWNSLEIPDTSTLSSGTYWIALSSSNNTGLSFDTGTSGDSRINGTAFGPLPDPFSAGSPSDWNFSFYADYCAEPGTFTPTRTSSWSPTPTVTLTSTPTRTETPLCGTSYSFGQNFISAGATPQIFNGVGSAFCMPATLTVTGRVTRLRFYAGASGGNVQMALYNNSANTPSTKIVESGGQAAVSGVNNLDVPNTAPLAPGVYWIVVVPQTSVNLFAEYDGTSGYWMNGSYGSLPSPSTGGAVQGYAMSLFADFCVDSSSPTPVPTTTWTPTPTSTRTSTPTRTETPAPNCQGSYFFGQNFVPAQATPMEFNIHYGSIFSMPATLTVTGHVTNLRCITGGVGAGVNLQMALYTNSGGNPGTKIVESNGQAGVAGVNTFDVPNTAALSPGTYWVVLAGSGPVTLSSFYNDPIAVGKWFSGGYNNFSTTASGVFSPGYDYAFYAGFCVDTTSPTPQPTATWSSTATRTATPSPTITETPVCGSPTNLGISSVQTSQQFGGGNLLATKVTLGSTGRVLRLHAYVTSGSANMRLAFYNNLVDGSYPAGRPNVLLTQSNIQATSPGWNTFNVPDTAILAAGTYWIGVVHDNQIGNLYLSAGNVTNGGYVEGSGMGPLGNISGGGPNWDYPLSVYAHVCP